MTITQRAALTLHRNNILNFVAICALCTTGRADNALEPAFTRPPAEKVILIRDGEDLDQVRELLAKGWTVKHQSASTAIARYGIVQITRDVILFTLTPPPPEVIKANAEAERIEREKLRERKRAEWEARKEAKP